MLNITTMPFLLVFVFSPTGRLATLRLCNYAHYTTAGLRIFVTSASGKYAKGIGAPFMHPPPTVGFEPTSHF